MTKPIKGSPPRIVDDTDMMEDPMVVFLTGNPPSDEEDGLPVIDEGTHKRAADLVSLKDRGRVVGFKNPTDQIALDKFEQDRRA